MVKALTVVALIFGLGFLPVGAVSAILPPLAPLADGKTAGCDLIFETAPVGNHSDDLDVHIIALQDRRAVGHYFGAPVWARRFAPFYLTLKNNGHYPIEVSLGSILLLEHGLPDSKAKTPANAKSGEKGAFPSFLPPIPPGQVFERSRHIQYGWRTNLGLIVLTGVSLGFAAPFTVPLLIGGNMHRGGNRRLVARFQNLTLSRITVEPGEKTESWIFYRRVRKQQALCPQKVIFADIYTPKLNERSSFVIDYRPLQENHPGIRRKMDMAEMAELQQYRERHRGARRVRSGEKNARS